MGSENGTDIFGLNTTTWSYTLRVIFTLCVICHTWIKVRDHSKITLSLLKLNDGLQNSLIDVRRA